eukprot:gene7255-8063_t
MASDYGIDDAHHQQHINYGLDLSEEPQIHHDLPVKCPDEEATAIYDHGTAAVHFKKSANSEKTALLKDSGVSVSIFVNEKLQKIYTCITVADCLHRIVYTTLVANFILYASKYFDSTPKNVLILAYAFISVCAIFTAVSTVMIKSWHRLLHAIMIAFASYIIGVLITAVLTSSTVVNKKLYLWNVLAFLLICTGEAVTRTSIPLFWMMQDSSNNMEQHASFTYKLYWITTMLALILIAIITAAQQFKNFAIASSESPMEDDSAKEQPSRFLEYAMIKYGGTCLESDVKEAISLIDFSILMACLIPYWIVYAQCWTTYYYQGLHFDTRVGELHVPVAWIGLSSTLIVVILAPILDRTLYPALLKKDIHVPLVWRIAFGMLMALISVVLAGCIEVSGISAFHLNQTFVQEVGRLNFEAVHTSIFCQIPQYLLLGLSDVFTSLTALNIANKLCKGTFQRLAVGFYYSTFAAGHLLALVIVSFEWVPKESSRLSRVTTMANKNPKFTIPKKATSAELLKEADPDSREFKDLTLSIKNSLWNANCGLQVNKIELVSNPTLNSEYAEKKQLMQKNGERSSKQHTDMYGYKFVENYNQAKSICKNGLTTNSAPMQAINCIGDPKFGVYLSRCPDILTKIPLRTNTRYMMVVFSIIKGRIKVMEEQHAVDKAPIEPTPNYNGHFSKDFHKTSNAANFIPCSKLFDSCQMFFYEFNLMLENIYVTRPRQCLPHAVVHFVIMPPTTIAPPIIKLPMKVAPPKPAEVEAVSKPDLVSSNRFSMAIENAIVLWRGQLLNKAVFIADCKNEVEDFPVAQKLAINAIQKSAHEVKRAKRKEYLHCEIYPIKTSSSFSKLKELLVTRDEALRVKLHQDYDLFILPTCQLTRQLGITDENYPEVLHLLFTCKVADNSFVKSIKGFFTENVSRVCQSRMLEVEKLKSFTPFEHPPPIADIDKESLSPFQCDEHFDQNTFPIYFTDHQKHAISIGINRMRKAAREDMIMSSQQYGSLNKLAGFNNSSTTSHYEYSSSKHQASNTQHSKVQKVYDPRLTQRSRMHPTAHPTALPPAKNNPPTVAHAGQEPQQATVQKAGLATNTGERRSSDHRAPLLHAKSWTQNYEPPPANDYTKASKSSVLDNQDHRPQKSNEREANAKRDSHLNKSVQNLVHEKQALLDKLNANLTKVNAQESKIAELRAAAKQIPTNASNVDTARVSQLNAASTFVPQWTLPTKAKPQQSDIINSKFITNAPEVPQSRAQESKIAELKQIPTNASGVDTARASKLNAASTFVPQWTLPTKTKPQSDIINSKFITNASNVPQSRAQESKIAELRAAPKQVPANASDVDTARASQLNAASTFVPQWTLPTKTKPQSDIINSKFITNASNVPQSRAQESKIAELRAAPKQVLTNASDVDTARASQLNAASTFVPQWTLSTKTKPQSDIINSKVITSAPEMPQNRAQESKIAELKQIPTNASGIDTARASQLNAASTFVPQWTLPTKPKPQSDIINSKFITNASEMPQNRAQESKIAELKQIPTNASSEDTARASQLNAASTFVPQWRFPTKAKPQSDIINSKSITNAFDVPQSRKNVTETSSELKDGDHSLSKPENSNLEYLHAKKDVAEPAKSLSVNVTSVYSIATSSDASMVGEKQLLESKLVVVPCAKDATERGEKERAVDVAEQSTTLAKVVGSNIESEEQRSDVKRIKNRAVDVAEQSTTLAKVVGSNIESEEQRSDVKRIKNRAVDVAEQSTTLAKVVGSNIESEEQRSDVKRMKNLSTGSSIEQDEERRQGSKRKRDDVFVHVAEKKASNGNETVDFTMNWYDEEELKKFDVMEADDVKPASKKERIPQLNETLMSGIPEKESTEAKQVEEEINTQANGKAIEERLLTLGKVADDSTGVPSTNSITALETAISNISVENLHADKRVIEMDISAGSQTSIHESSLSVLEESFCDNSTPIEMEISEESQPEIEDISPPRESPDDLQQDLSKDYVQRRFIDGSTVQQNLAQDFMQTLMKSSQNAARSMSLSLAGTPVHQVVDAKSETLHPDAIVEKHDAKSESCGSKKPVDEGKTIVSSNTTALTSEAKTLVTVAGVSTAQPSRDFKPGDKKHELEGRGNAQVKENAPAQADEATSSAATKMASNETDKRIMQQKSSAKFLSFEDGKPASQSHPKKAIANISEAKNSVYNGKVPKERQRSFDAQHDRGRTQQRGRIRSLFDNQGSREFSPNNVPRSRAYPPNSRGLDGLYDRTSRNYLDFQDGVRGSAFASNDPECRTQIALRREGPRIKPDYKDTDKSLQRGRAPSRRRANISRHFTGYHRQGEESHYEDNSEFYGDSDYYSNNDNCDHEQYYDFLEREVEFGYEDYDYEGRYNDNYRVPCSEEITNEYHHDFDELENCQRREEIRHFRQSGSLRRGSSFLSRQDHSQTHREHDFIDSEFYHEHTGADYSDHHTGYAASNYQRRFGSSASISQREHHHSVVRPNSSRRHQISPLLDFSNDFDSEEYFDHRGINGTFAFDSSDSLAPFDALYRKRKEEMARQTFSGPSNRRYSADELSPLDNRPFFGDEDHSEEDSNSEPTKQTSHRCEAIKNDQNNSTKSTMLNKSDNKEDVTKASKSSTMQHDQRRSASLRKPAVRKASSRCYRSSKKPRSDSVITSSVFSKSAYRKSLDDTNRALKPKVMRLASSESYAMEAETTNKFSILPQDTSFDGAVDETSVDIYSDLEDDAEDELQSIAFSSPGHPDRESCLIGVKNTLSSTPLPEQKISKQKSSSQVNKKPVTQSHRRSLTGKPRRKTCLSSVEQLKSNTQEPFYSYNESASSIAEDFYKQMAELRASYKL